ncbi:cyanobactin maturation protease PatG family protein [Kitasatospora sp. NPDC054939]
MEQEYPEYPEYSEHPEYREQPVPVEDGTAADPGRPDPALRPAGSATGTATAAATVAPMASGCGCGGEPQAPGGMPERVNPFVYVIGQIDFRFPSLGVEKEVAQAVARAETENMTDRQAIHAVISQPENRYLARQLCYVLSVQGMEAYVLRASDPVEFDRLVEAIRPEPGATDLDVVIGRRGPLAPPGLCNGLTIPVVDYDQVYSFASEHLLAAIKPPEGMARELFESSSKELLRRVMQLGDNAGDTDPYRALNYLTVRYPRIYEKTVEAFAQDSSLSAVSFRESRLSGVRTVIDVLFCYTGRRTDVTEKFFVRVDVTEEWPFLIKCLSPYYDR